MHEDYALQAIQQYSVLLLANSSRRIFDPDTVEATGSGLVVSKTTGIASSNGTSNEERSKSFLLRRDVRMFSLELQNTLNE